MVKVKSRIIEILENNADWANTYGSDVVFSGKFEDVADEIEKLINPIDDKPRRLGNNGNF